jgi:diguanylate cyclase (GGDEF)-like protein
VNKKITWIIVTIIAILLIGFGIIYFMKEDTDTSLTSSEKKWIEANKNKVIDLSIINDVPILNVNGEGVLFDFLNDLESKTKLEFNKLNYSEDTSTDYAFKLVDSKGKNDILIYRDNYVVLTKEKRTFNKSSDIKDMVIGVLEDDLSNINTYLENTSNVAYKTFDSSDKLFDGLKDNKVNAIVVPKITNFDKIASDDDVNIAYNITKYTKDYVLTLGDNEKLNKIITKYYNKWSDDKYTDSFYKYFSENYFTANEIDEKTKAKFRSKRYVYGFVTNSPFDMTTKDGLKGLNYGFLKNFVKSANVEITYKKYNNYNDLLKDFNANNLDIIFAYQNDSKYKMDVYETSSVYNEKVVILSSSLNNNIYSSVSSLKDETVKVIKSSKISEYLKNHSVNVKEYNNSNDLISSVGMNDVLALDYYSYDYFVRDELKKFKIDNEFELDSEYNFIARDISTNKTFNEFFDFYLSFVSSEEVINSSYIDLLNYNDSNKIMKVVLSLISAFLVLILGLLTFRFIKNKKKHKVKFSKTDKLRYVDALTSLKNRNYLNDNVEVWDSSEVYPQAIIIVDLNNVAYINDNFGHAEGDKLIVEAAGILIHNQLSNSEIIRSSGNEFLIYSVGHDEKETITYIRKLNKEFKNLSHGFGAAIGYSMITDGIKSIDDAVNEATILMKNTKEETSNQ